MGVPLPVDGLAADDSACESDDVGRLTARARRTCGAFQRRRTFFSSDEETSDDAFAVRANAKPTPRRARATRANPRVPRKGTKANPIRIGKMKQVFNGTAMMTEGMLRREHLMLNKRGKIVSKKASESASRRFATTDTAFKTVHLAVADERARLNAQNAKKFILVEANPLRRRPHGF